MLTRKLEMQMKTLFSLKDSARMEINLKKYIAAIGICFMALGAACIMKTDPEEVGEELPELIIGSDNYEPYN